MGLKHPLMRVDSTATGRCQQCALHALCLFEIVGCLNSTLGSIVANDSTIPKGQTIYCLPVICMVKSGGFKIMTPLCGHTAHNSGISNAGRSCWRLCSDKRLVMHLLFRP